jgi:hypothetical protein
MVNEARKRFTAIITFRKSLKKLSCAVNDAENVSLFTVGSQYIVRIYYLLYGILAQKPNPNFFFMKREFVNKFWIFCTPVLAVLRIHLSTQGKQGSVRAEH